LLVVNEELQTLEIYKENRRNHTCSNSECL